MDRADAQLQPQPLGQEFLNPRPRQPEPQASATISAASPGPTSRHSLSSIPGQQRIHRPVARHGPGPMPAGAGRFVIAMVHHPQRSAPAAPDRPSAGRPPESRCRPPPRPGPAAGHSRRRPRDSAGRSSCAWNTWVRPIPGAPGCLPGLRAPGSAPPVSPPPVSPRPVSPRRGSAAPPLESRSASAASSDPARRPSAPTAPDCSAGANCSSGPWFNRSHASLRSASNRNDSPRNASTSKDWR